MRAGAKRPSGPPPLRVHIDELVVLGVPLTGADGLGPAVEAALADRLTRDRPPAPPPGGDRAEPRPVTVTLPARPVPAEAVAELLAGAVREHLEAAP
jgi:hypothetical protein